jgi:hypothetical protein
VLPAGIGCSVVGRQSAAWVAGQHGRGEIATAGAVDDCRFGLHHRDGDLIQEPGTDHGLAYRRNERLSPARSLRIPPNS